MSLFLIRMLISALGLWIASLIVPGVEIKGLETIFASAVLLGLANALVRPLLIFFTLPLTVLTLGLFLLVINAIVLGLVAWLLPNFTVDGFFAALLGSIVVSVVSWFASRYLGRTGRS